MYTFKINYLPKNTVKIEVKIPWSQIYQEKEKAINKFQKELTLPGYRKGKAPIELVKKNVSSDKLYQEVIKNLLTRIFNEVTTQEKLEVIGQPKIELTKVQENKDWEILIFVGLKPKINLGNYKEEIKKLIQKEKKVDIWIPGKENNLNKDQKSETLDQKLLSKILEKLINLISCEISDILIEEELNHRLTQLLDDIQKIGLTVESYLKSKNLTMEELKNQITREIEETYKLEFILQEIADKENITVEEKDLNALYQSITDPQKRDLAKNNAYFYSTILRKQKTLDFLLNL